MKIIRIWVIACAVFAAIFSSCGRKTHQAQSENQKFKIGICVAQETEATRAMYRAIVERAPAENASVEWISAEQNEATQEHAVENFLSGGVQGIIFDPVNPLAAGLLIDKAAGRGIPVAGIGSVPETHTEDVFVLPDIDKAAENLVRTVLPHRRRPGKILILMTESPDSTETALVRSMLSILTENGIGYNAFGLSPDSAIARRSMNTILFSPSPPSAVIVTRIFYGSIARDLFRLGLVVPSPVLAVYSDAEEAKNALKNGVIDILVDPQPGVIGATVLSSIVRLIRKLPVETGSQRIGRGEFFTPVIKTPVMLLMSPDLPAQSRSPSGDKNPRHR
jgi:ABC-type sugar transport system substrate-binding protein